MSLLQTADLLTRARAGDADAKAELFARYRVPLDRFLHARLSSPARALYETDDLVQEVFSRALARLGDFQYRGIGSFWSYLRQIGMNHVIQVSRKYEVPGRAATRPIDTVEAPVADVATPLGALLKKEEIEAFDRALSGVSLEYREVLLMRLELGLDYATIATECGLPSADAARMTVRRAIERVVREMRFGNTRAGDRPDDRSRDRRR